MEQQYHCRKDYRTVPGVECLNSCIYHWMMNDGLPVSQSDIFFAGDGGEVTYQRQQHEFHIHTRQNQSNLQFIRTYLPQSHFDNVLAMHEGDRRDFLYTSIKAQRKLTLHVSGAHMPYSQTLSKERPVSHFVNVIDCDCTGHRVLVSDGCAAANGGDMFHDWIDTEALLESWEIMQGEYFEFRWNCVQVSEIKKMSERNLKKAVKQYIKKPSKWFRWEIHGQESIRMLMQDVRALFDDTVFHAADCHPVGTVVTQSIVPEFQSPVEVIKHLYEMLRLQGYISEKWFFLEKMREKQTDEEICRQYEDQIREYHKICMLIMKGMLRRQVSLVDEAVERTNQLVEAECRILQEYLYA